MSKIENPSIDNYSWEDGSQMQDVEMETNGQLRINFCDKKNDELAEKKSEEPVQSKEPVQGVVIHIDKEEEDGWENPDYTGEYTDFYRNR